MNLLILNHIQDERESQDLLSQIENYYFYDPDSKIYDYCLSEKKEEFFSINGVKL